MKLGEMIGGWSFTVYDKNACSYGSMQCYIPDIVRQGETKRTGRQIAQIGFRQRFYGLLMSARMVSASGMTRSAPFLVVMMAAAALARYRKSAIISLKTLGLR